MRLERIRNENTGVVTGKAQPEMQAT